MPDQKEQFTLRVKRGSELEKVMELLLDGQLHSKEDCVSAGGLSRSWMLAGWLPTWVDNVGVTKQDGQYGLSYVDIRPRQPISIAQAEFQVSGDVVGTAASDEEFGEMIWPDAPPLIETMDVYRKPKFFGAMNALTKLGRHVSLSGPPGIGKSTAVEQLASEVGMPLVNISADAGLRRRDLVGTVEMVNGTTKFLVGEYAAAVVNGWWAKIDEINAADPDAVMFINSQLAPPHVINVHGRQYAVHPNFRLFVTYNPGLVGTKPLPPAFKDRFYPVKLTFPTEAQLHKILTAHRMPDVEDGGWSYTVLAFAAQMWDAHVRGQMRYQISPRRLIDAVLLMNENLAPNVKDALKMAVIATIDSPIESRVAEQILGGI